MTVLKDVRDVTWNQAVLAGFLFLGAVSPGFLMLFLYKPELVASLSAAKVIVFALALSLPVCLLNAVIWSEIKKSTDKPGVGDAGVALCMTFMSMYGSILLGYWFELEFRHLLIALFWAEISVAVLLRVMVHFEKSDDTRTEAETQPDDS